MINFEMPARKLTQSDKSKINRADIKQTKTFQKIPRSNNTRIQKFARA